MCSQKEWEKEVQDSLSPVETVSSKQKRFRFSETERIKALKELFNILCEDVVTTEEELWGNLHAVLCHDEERFKSCSLRLLKEHMLEQMSKFRKYDSEEATESGKERLKTEWGDTMRLLQTVWCNYEHIVRTAQVTNKSGKGGRPRKEVSREKSDVAAAQAIRQAALQTIEDGDTTMEFSVIDVEQQDIIARPSSSASSEDVTVVATSVEVPFESPLETHNYARPINETEKQKFNQREHTEAARKRRGRASDVFVFLSEKTAIEQKQQAEELQLRKRQFEVSTNWQQEEMAYKKAKLEFEERQWKDQAEDRNLERKRNAILNTLLENMLVGNVNKNV